MAAFSRNTRLWLVWLIASLLLALLLWGMLSGRLAQGWLMPGELTRGHHQLEDDCQLCHTSPFGGGEVLDEACLECHGADRVKPQDSHPRTKFTDPRNAELLLELDALSCVTCHTEHRPEITHKDGLTRPLDLCVHCHSKVGEDRPSHQGMEFSSCKDSGCHNFHNNRDIYTDFLTKNLDKPDLLPERGVPELEYAGMLDELADYPHDRWPVQPLEAASADAPASAQGEDHAEILAEWAASGHAAQGVNCTACHLLPEGDGSWSDQTQPQACAQCHGVEIERFGKGLHGMRPASGLPPMRVEDARLPVAFQASHRELGCNSCHDAHGFDTRDAAARACLTCHVDEHTQAWKESPHGMLWEAGEPDGVSCATCHMPRINYDVSDWVSRILVDHNQSANLSPNTKMLRSACLHCHGLNFSLQALADPEQIRTNFAFTPALGDHPSMQLARRDLERYLRETARPESE